MIILQTYRLSMCTVTFPSKLLDFELSPISHKCGTLSVWVVVLPPLQNCTLTFWVPEHMPGTFSLICKGGTLHSALAPHFLCRHRSSTQLWLHVTCADISTQLWLRLFLCRHRCRAWTQGTTPGRVPSLRTQPLPRSGCLIQSCAL